MRVVVVLLAVTGGVVALRDAASYGDAPVGLAVWALYLVAALLLAGMIGLALARRSRRRAALRMVALIVLFPVSTEWHDDETVQGLLPSVQAVALAVGLQSTPSVKYTEGCCE